ncbi:hypothetical protein ACFLXA_05755 [Chloroflexota bacterium]
MNKLKIFMIGLMVIALLATFMAGCSDEEEFDLKISVDPAGGGTTSPAAGTYTYEEGDVITIKATAATGYEFDSWTGDVADTSAATTTVTMDANQTVTANFVELVTYTLTMAVDPTGGGTTDPAVGTHDYDDGTEVTITATAADGYEFDSWTGDVDDTSDATTTVTMDADQSVTANFVEDEPVILTIDNTINEIIELEGADAMLRACLGDEIMDGGLVSMGGSMSLPTIQGMAPPGTITDEMLDCVEAGLLDIQGIAPPEPLTIDATINEIVARAGGEDMLRACLGDEIMDGGLVSMGGSMSLPTIQGMAPPGTITDEMIDCVEAGLLTI